MNVSLFLALGSIFILFWIFFSLVYWTLRTGISPMPSSYKVNSLLIKIIPATLPKGKVYELGSGWGTLAISLAKKYPELEIIGFELSLFPFLVSKLLAKILRIKNLKFIRKDFLYDSLDEAQLIVCYLYPKIMVKLESELKKKLTYSTMIVSHTFALPRTKPIQTYVVSDLYYTKIYIYKI